MRIHKKALAVSLILGISAVADAQSNAKDRAVDDYTWTAMFYYGQMTQSILNRVLRFNYESLGPAQLYAAEWAYQFPKSNVIRRLFSPIFSTVELAINGTYQDDPVGEIYQFNPMLIFRWLNFPWNNTLRTTLAIGEGVSYSSRIPSREIRDTKKAESAAKFLNFLMFEASFALPKYPNSELVYRIHHRSGVFGLYTKGITGSTAVAIGFRKRFA